MLQYTAHSRRRTPYRLNICVLKFLPCPLREAQGIPYVFVEPQFNTRVVAQAARDAGVGVAAIYSLPNSEYPTYLEMMRANADSLARHLR